MAKEKPKGEEGAVYVWSGGTQYVKPMITADTLLDCIKNKYVFDALNKLKSMIFTKKYTIDVLDQDRQRDDELSSRMMSMAESVRLWPKIQIAWTDAYRWGPGIFNPVWDWVDGEYVLTDLRRLPPESFANQAPGSMYCDDILRGICVGPDQQVHYYQTSGIAGYATREIKNVFVVRDPALPGIAGQSMLIPLVPIISMANFTWKAQMQKVNRVGAPSIFIKVTDPRGKAEDPESDLNYAQKILNNWGNNSAYQLRENMTVEPLSVTDNESALRTIQQLERDIQNYFTPSSLFKKEGDTLGGNAAAEKDVAELYIAGQRSWVEDAFEPLFDTFFQANGYEGYELEIHIGQTSASLGDVERAQAETGFNTRVLSPNEVRAKLGLEAVTDEQLVEFSDLWEQLNPPSSMGFPVGMKDHRKTKPEVEAERKIKEAQAKALQDIIRGL